ncbi:glucosamine-6-phosphate deaminase [Halalkalibacter hemicellulosilyticus]|uniref:Glucosamine-6-phosphate deaminase n=1 Tax=Halalkalibacter hemicellulosilyticusJCM 9152 TaxID=1236971 RepID=W4QMF6_9BACI|nr:glucosamine-6-phosphate deaminase [Halalkalibacter hemicellulosilyticus]GAE32509.1 glucosamine-6-phosphate deaminase [Halalkalibacter hemicellulosilyticusJCM 9152]
MKTVHLTNYEEMSTYAYEIIKAKLLHVNKPVLGLATGSTPERLYELLVKGYTQGQLSFSNVTTFNLDEYIGLKPADQNSYHYYMDEHLFKHINIRESHIHIPDGITDNAEQECLRYEQLIKEHGGIDVQLLGLGLNGHIGFNEPGTAFSTRTHIVDLKPSTRKANARFFEREEDVPNQAITMGIQTIMESKEILLLASGEKKRPAIKRLLEGDVCEDFPASILHNHPNVTVIIG